MRPSSQTPRWLRHSFAVTLFIAVPAAAQQQQQRPLEADDIFRIEKLGAATASPDGDLVAYVRVAAQGDSPVQDMTYMWGNERSEVWIIPARGGAPRKIAGDARAGVGFWGPEWSPDGRRLALYGSTAEGHAHVHVWERESGALRRAGERGVDPIIAQRAWVSDTELVFHALPEGKRPGTVSSRRQTPEIASQEWAKARAGKEVTASVLESGVPFDPTSRPQGALLLHDARTGQTRTLAEGNFLQSVRSPGGRRVASFVEVEPFRPRADRLIEHRQLKGRFTVRVLGREGVLPEGGLSRVMQALPGSVEWSPDGSRFAFAGTTEADPYAPAGILVFVPASGELVGYALGDLELDREMRDWISAPALRWTADNKLMIFARKTGSERSDWWVLGRSGPKRNLTAKLASAPAEIHRVASGRAWVGIAEGDVWRLSLSGEPVNLTAGVEEAVTDFAWLDRAQAAGRGVSEAVVRTEKRLEEVELFRIALSGRGGAERLTKPKSTAELATYSAATGLAVFRSVDRTGTYLWTVPHGGEARTVVEANTFLRGIAEGETRTIEYRGMDGDTLLAWVLLPPGYREGERYPVVTWAYAEWVASPDRPSILTHLNEAHSLNLQILAARGYAVLMPSMPLEPTGEASDPYIGLAKGVLPAIDKLIELGIADPDRLAILGQSNGGYSVQGLVTQTDRFRTAISLAGFSNLISSYGQHDARLRYTDRSHENVFEFAIAETGQGRMGAPPWTDTQRYLRNSPIAYVERVNTPILLVHGDLDYVHVQQDEEFFQALYRQGKRARFVRYWGEDHLLMSPANIRHMWEQIFDWLGEHLKVEGRTAAAGG